MLSCICPVNTFNVRILNISFLSPPFFAVRVIVRVDLDSATEELSPWKLNGAPIPSCSYETITSQVVSALAGIISRSKKSRLLRHVSGV